MNKIKRPIQYQREENIGDISVHPEVIAPGKVIHVAGEDIAEDNGQEDDGNKPPFNLSEGKRFRFHGSNFSILF